MAYGKGLYGSHPEALDALKKRMSGVRFDPDEYHIILTPDRYTLGIEQALFSGGGSINCEVLTLSRLCRRVLPERNVLSREGSVMLVENAIKRVADKLRFYKHAARYYDFARDVLATLLQMGASGVSPSDISATGAAAEKLSDLALIAAEYARLKEDDRDATDRLVELIAAVGESEFVKRSHIKAIGYSDPTKLNRDVFAALARSCKSFELFEAERQSEILPRKEKIQVFVSPEPVTAYKEIATRIRNYVTDGGRYGDVSIVCPEPRALVRILGEYDVRVYAETSVTLDKTPPLAAIAALYKLGEQGADELVAFCKNPFSGCDRDDAERLQNYLAERGIARGVFKTDITDEGAKRARDHARTLYELFRSHGKFADGVRAVIDKAGFETVQKRLYGDDTSMLTPLTDTLELLNMYGADDFGGDAEAFFSAAHSAEVKSLPRYGDCVTVCAPSSLRMTRCKMLYVVDFNDGLLPAVTLDTGLLSDSEILSVKDKIEPTAREANARESAELAAVVNNAEYVFCSYSTGAGGKAALLAAADTEEFSSDGNENVLKITDDANELARFACAKSAAREIAARKLTKFSSALERAAGETRKAKEFCETVDLVAPKSLSASELTAWFECPYKRFLKYTVGVTERKKGKMSAPDFGIIVHSFMQKLIDEYIESDELDCSDAHVARLVSDALDELGIDLSAEDDAVVYDRILSDARRFALDNKKVIDRGGFKPIATEKRFDGGIKLGSSEIPLVGVIDRIDACGGCARIIDYKTGSKSFDLGNCRNGTDMQLPLYAAAVDGHDVVGVFYMTMRPEYNAKGELLDGAFVKEVDIARAMDAKLVAGTRSDIIKARLKNDGDFNNPSKTVMDKAEFDGLKKICIDTAGRAADELASGYIERTPVDGACTYCPFGGLCPSKKERSKDGE